MSVNNNLFGGLSSTRDIFTDNSNNGLKSDTDLQTTIDELARFSEVTSYDITILEDDWIGDAVPLEARVELPEVDAFSVIGLFLSPKTNHAMRDTIDQAGIAGGKQGNGYFTLYSFGTKPDMDIDIKITVSNNVAVSKYFDLAKAKYDNGVEVVPASELFDAISKPNLVMNPAFTINQNNRTSYIGSDLKELPCLDCWKVIGDGTLLKVLNNGGIKITNSSTSLTSLLKQTIKVTSDMYNNKVTTSIMVTDTTPGSAIVKLISNNGITLAGCNLVTGLNILTTTDNIPDDCKSIDLVIKKNGTNASITISSVKVEVGAMHTPYTPRPYTEEMMLCRNYNGVDETASFGFKNVTVKPTDFKVNDSMVGYPYKADITCANVTEQHCATVIFNQSDAQSGVFAPITNTSEGIVTIYSTKVPSTDIIINSIVCTKLIDRGL